MKKERGHKVYQTRLKFLKRPLRVFRLNVVQGRFDALMTLETIPFGTFGPGRFNRPCPNFGFKARGIGHLHDDVILHLRPESFRILLYRAN